MKCQRCGGEPRPSSKYCGPCADDAMLEHKRAWLAGHRAKAKRATCPCGNEATGPRARFCAPCRSIVIGNASRARAEAGRIEAAEHRRGLLGSLREFMGRT